MNRIAGKLRIFLTAVGLIGLSLPAYGSAIEIKIAIASAMEQHTDPSASPCGEMFFRGVDVGLKKIESELKLLGIQLQWRKIHASQNPDELKKLAAELLEDGTHVLIGPVYSSDLLVIAQEFQKHTNPPLIVNAAATTNSLTQFGEFLISIAMLNSQQAQLLAAEVLRANKPVKVAAVTAVDCIYCQDLKRSFLEKVESHHAVELTEVSVLAAQTQFSEVIEKLKNKEWDFVFLPNYDLLNARMVSALEKAGIVVHQFLGGDGWAWSTAASIELIRNTKFRGMTLSHSFESYGNLQSPTEALFQLEYSKRYQQKPSAISGQGYDGAMALGQVLRGLQGQRGTDLRSRLKAAARQPLRIQSILGEIRLLKGLPAKRPMNLIRYGFDEDTGKLQRSGTVLNE